MLQPRYPLARETTAARPEARRRVGLSAQKDTPLDSHAEWSAPPDREDPVTIISQQNEARVPELVPLRHYRMLKSPFSFFRGAARIMVHDLAHTATVGLFTQICGDAHLSNFGAFGTPERRLIFDLNDFDETLPGPFEWDVKRLAASLFIVGTANGFGDDRSRAVVSDTVANYRESMAEFAKKGALDLWYAGLPVEEVEGLLPSKKLRKGLRKNVKKALRSDSVAAQQKLTEEVDGSRRFVTSPPLIYRLQDLLPPGEFERLRADVPEWFGSYVATLPEDRRRLVRRYRFVDMALKVVGVGSVGTRCFVIYLEDSLGNPLFLQVKEALASVLEDVLPSSAHVNRGERVVMGQRLMQAASDIFLGWSATQQGDRDFYFRQLKDWKYSSKVESMDPERLTVYGHVCAWNLARAHARGGDPLVIAGYLGDTAAFESAVTEFAVAYAGQNEADYACFKEAATSGRIEALSEEELVTPDSHRR